MNEKKLQISNYLQTPYCACSIDAGSSYEIRIYFVPVEWG